MGLTTYVKLTFELRRSQSRALERMSSVNAQQKHPIKGLIRQNGHKFN
jgi:hypothetical protein